jgi:hypothetical protein
VVERFERSTIPANGAGIRTNALRFGAERFKLQLVAAVDSALQRRAAGDEGIMEEHDVDGGWSAGGA